MLRRFFQLLVALVPLALFAIALQPVQQRLYGGHAAQGILLLLVALAVLALVEGLIFRYWILPGWGEKVAERLYAGSYLPENDALAQLVERIEHSKDAAALEQLQQLVLQQPRRLRGWLELARLQQDLLQDDGAAALATLEQAASAMRDPEDAALLLYRAARLCDKKLHDSAAAARLFQRAVTQFPGTVYGRKAAESLKEL